MTNQLKPYWQNYIDDQWVDGGSGRIRIEDPATGLLLAEQACADSNDVDKAVQSALLCHQSGELRNLRPVERGRMVQGMGKFLLENLDEISRVLCLDSGKPLWEAVMEVEAAARYLEYYGNQAETVEGRSIPLGSKYFDFTVYEPYGVTAHIIPWNYPIEMTARSVAAALATGNTCVIKTPEIDPLVISYLANAAESVGLPKGAIQIICGYGHEAGAALSAHPDVNQIVFTGSVQTGIHIATSAAQNVVPSVLELGGKSAAVVFNDANIDALIDDIRWGIFFNSGQVCSAMSRLIVHADIHDEVVERAAAMANSISVGPGIDRTSFGANMGALVSARQQDQAVSMCESAINQGARAAAGGGALERDGYFLQPTIFDQVTPDMKIAQEEAFAPILSVLKFANDREAIEIANGTQYGLVGGVYTQDIDRAMTVARDMRAGQIFVNEWYAGGVETPFGGYGKSGYGREKGREALLNYVQTKNIAVSIKN